KWPADQAVAASRQPDALRLIWTELARQGWLVLGGDPENRGLRYATVLLEELGRSGCPAPLLDAFLANTILSRVANRDKSLETLAADLHAGRAVVSVGLGALDDDPDAGCVTVGGGNGGTTLSGTISFVEGTSIATHLLVFTGRASEVAIVSRDASGVT